MIDVDALIEATWASRRSLVNVPRDREPTEDELHQLKFMRLDPIQSAIVDFLRLCPQDMRIGEMRQAFDAHYKERNYSTLHRDLWRKIVSSRAAART